MELWQKCSCQTSWLTLLERTIGNWTVTHGCKQNLILRTVEGVQPLLQAPYRTTLSAHVTITSVTVLYNISHWVNVNFSYIFVFFYLYNLHSFLYLRTPIIKFSKKETFKQIVRPTIIFSYKSQKNKPINTTFLHRI